MSQITTSQEAEEAIQQITKRTQTDSEFRQLCLSDPKAAAKLATGKDIPEGFVLRFVENQRASLTVVLPDPIDFNNELSDEDLEQVAGGNSKPDHCGISCGGSCQLSDFPKQAQIGITFTRS